MAIVDDDIERLKATVSIVDVVAEIVQLRKVGRNHVGLCPFHAEKTPSFNVREETGRYRCFGCDKSGDAFTFVQETKHVDFVGAVEYLAAKVGMQISYTDSAQSAQRARRKRLVEAMEGAVEWYHQRLLTGSDAGPARGYLRSRGLTGDIVRQFRIGWAPDDWDALSKGSGLDAELLRTVGLGFTNRVGRMQDALRGRIVFPIFSDSGEAIAVGGRILPGSTDPAKYKNSPETPIYAKSKTLYGLNWAKAGIAASDQAVVCEGYTDVIGFHRAGVARAVATCGTAFTEEHVRLLKRYASRVVLAFDADNAGQGAAERFYEWEQQYQVQVSVARLPDGKDPGELAQTDEGRALLAAAVAEAVPFLGFRLGRVIDRAVARTPEERVRLAERAMAVVNEHPNAEVRKLYAGEVAAQTGIAASDLVSIAQRRQRDPSVEIRRPRASVVRENAEFVAIALLAQDWNSIASWLIEELFADDVLRRSFLALAEADGDLDAAIEDADPDAREVLERAAVADFDVDPDVEARNLIAAAARRVLAAPMAGLDPDRIREDREARLQVEELGSQIKGAEAAEWLLGWLHRRTGQRLSGGR
ncbi:DNA primase [Desertimonas flava]|jgi:DNA primase|uniref:DNA primase n=1 Tax=Desertimonas flava TaxID=2064846 RepID=UPI000E34E1BE|nr:DNA primase [Desertimonas flava]